MKDFILLIRKGQSEPTQAMLGLIPAFLKESDPRSAREQINDRYAHGGGWFSIKGFKHNAEDNSIKYPGNPRMRPIATAWLHDKERIFIYPHGWVMILQPDGQFNIARLD